MKYGVSLPFTGYVYVEVEAENKKEALEQAQDNATLNDMCEWEFTEKVCSGHVSYAVLTEAEVEEVE